MQYADLRLLHITCAAISVALFALRWSLSLRAIPWRLNHWLRIAPHANDTALLGAAIALASWSRQYPWQHFWLGAKVLLLLIYIALGKRALRENQSQGERWLWGSAALITVFSIIGLAMSRWPGPAL